MDSSLRSTFSWYVSYLWAFEAVFTGLYRGVNRMACISLYTCSCMGKSNLIPGISALRVLFLARQLLLEKCFIFKQDKEQTALTASDQKQSFYCKHQMLWAVSSTWLLVNSVVWAKHSGQEREERNQKSEGWIGIYTDLSLSQSILKVISWFLSLKNNIHDKTHLLCQINSMSQELYICNIRFPSFSALLAVKLNAHFMVHEANHWRERRKSHWGHWSCS